MHKSLVGRLMAMFLLLAVPSIAIFGTVAWFAGVETARESAASRVLTAITVEEAELKAWVADQVRHLRFLENFPVVGEAASLGVNGNLLPPDVKSRLDQRLASFVRINPEFLNVSFVSAQSGEILASSDASLAGTSPLTAVGQELVGEEKGARCLTLDDGAGGPLLTVACPVEDPEGKMRGFILGRLDLRFMDQVVSRFHGLGEGARAFVVDRRGVPLAVEGEGGVPEKRVSPGVEAVVSGESGVKRYVNHLGEDVFGGFRYLPGLKTGLVVEMDAAHAMIQAHGVTEAVLLVGLAVTVLSALFVYFLSRRVARPILAITDAARAVARGDLDRKAPVLSRDQIGDLAQTFNWMTRELADLYAGMREKMVQLQEARDAVTQTERHFRALIENATDFIAVMDREGRITYVSPSVTGIIGFAPEEIQDTTASQWFHPEDAERLMKRFPQMKAHSGILKADEYRIRHREGGYRILELYGNNLLHDPVIQGFVINARDVTLRRKAESELEAEKELLSVTLAGINDAVIATDAGGRITLLNEAAEKLCGYTREEAAGKPAAEVLNVLDAMNGEPVQDPLGQVLRTGEAWHIKGDVVILDKKNTATRVSANVAAIRNGGGRILGSVLTLRDMTERHAYEQELVKIEKLESLGVLAGGIAHDFNNILMSVLGNLSLARLMADSGGELHKKLVEGEKAALAARELTQQLLTFSSGGAPVTESAGLESLVREGAAFALSGSLSRCEYHLRENLWPAEVDPAQIRQVIQNLVLNASQAMPDGGMIRIFGENKEVGEGGGLLPLAPGRYVMLTVADTGPGIQEKDLELIFDPYFTTKKGGSGLGLATTFWIVSRHKGHIEVSSDPGKGAAFTLYLPASDELPIAMLEEGPMQRDGSGPVLVMDDDETVRRITADMLRYLGYEVTEASDGREAVDAYRDAMKNGGAFRAVIMDLTVPGGMGGTEALEKIKALDPDVRAVVSSGYSRHPIMSGFRDFGFAAVISKPFTPEKLRKVLLSVLNG